MQCPIWDRLCAGSTGVNPEDVHLDHLGECWMSDEDWGWRLGMAAAERAEDECGNERGRTDWNCDRGRWLCLTRRHAAYLSAREKCLEVATFQLSSSKQYDDHFATPNKAIGLDISVNPSVPRSFLHSSSARSTAAIPNRYPHSSSDIQQYRSYCRWISSGLTPVEPAQRRSQMGHRIPFVHLRCGHHLPSHQ